jgi:hypothetical protein
MKGRTTLILFGVLLVLASFVYFIEIKGKAKREKNEEKSKKLLTIDEDHIQQVTVQRQTDTLAFERNGDAWNIVRPVKSQGDKYAVKNLVTEIASAKSEREIPDVTNWADYGLTAPKFSVIVQSKTGKRDTLYVGDTNPTGSFLYMRKPGKSSAILAGTSLSTSLGKSLFDLRDRTALSFEKDDIRKLEIARGGTDLIVEKDKDGWILKSPIQFKANKSAVDELLNKVKYAEAKRFEAESPSELRQYGLQPPTEVLTLTTSQGVLKKLMIGGETGAQYYAKDEARTPVFTVDSSVVSSLKKNAFDLREKKVSEFESWNVKRAEIRSGDGRTFAFNKDTSNNWLVESPQKGKAKSSQITGIFSSLSGLEAKEFVGRPSGSLSKYGLDKPSFKVVLKDEKGDTLAHVLFGSRSGKEDVYVMNKRTGWVVKTKDGILKELSPKMDDVLEKEEPKKPANVTKNANKKT